MPLIPFLGSHAIFFLVTPYFHYNPHPGFVQMVRYLPGHGLLNISTTILHLHMLITHFVLAELPFLHLLDGLMITSKCLGVGAPMPFTSIFEKNPSCYKPCFTAHLSIFQINSDYFSFFCTFNPPLLFYPQKPYNFYDVAFVSCTSNISFFIGTLQRGYQHANFTSVCTL